MLNRQEYSYIIDNNKYLSDKAHFIINPYTNEAVGKVYITSKDDIEKAIVSSASAFKQTKKLPTHKRVEILNNIAKIVSERKEELASTITLESGKPITFSRAEIDRAIMTFSWGAKEAERIEGEVLNLDLAAYSENRFGIVRRFPIGPVLAIVPFNFPVNLAAHKIAPAIASGNTVVFKPSSSCLMSGVVLGEIITESGALIGMTNVITCSGSAINDFVNHDLIKFVSFTGSPAIGWSLKSRVNKQKITLELGGNAGVIVEGGIDIDSVAQRIALGAFGNAGQSCISVQRIFVHDSIFEEFAYKFVEVSKKLKVGDPFNEETVVGPLINILEAERAESWIREAVVSGAKLLCGGEREKAVLLPTVITNTKPDMKVNCQEIFAPVVTLEKYSKFEDAINSINDSAYGLQAAIFTNDLQKVFYGFAEIDVGGLIVNDYPSYRIDPMPYGGVKNSGFGREGLKYAIEEMTEPRLLVLNLSK